MATVLAARWLANQGKEDLIAEVLRTMTPLSRAEPGCLFYQPHRSVDDPRLFFIYEQYADQAAVDSHRSSSHFQEHVMGKAIPNLESRVVETFITDDF